MVQPLGMESGAIPDNQITASSHYSGGPISKSYPHFGRLNGDKQWCDSGHTNKLTEYVQVCYFSDFAVTSYIQTRLPKRAIKVFTYHYQVRILPNKKASALTSFQN